VTIIWILLAIVAVLVTLHFAWRWASRRWSLPCPTFLAWSLESPQRLSGTETTLNRIGFRPGQKILEIGPGPGRLLLPAALRILPGGEAVGIDIQPGMIERLKVRATQAAITNLTAILGDATQPLVPEASFALVFLCTALGEIPDRAAAVSQCFRALKAGGILSITEKFGDPHYQSRSTVKRLAEEAGFRLQSIQGGCWFFTATFIKPLAKLPVKDCVEEASEETTHACQDPPPQVTVVPVGPWSVARTRDRFLWTADACGSGFVQGPSRSALRTCGTVALSSPIR
jgi:SAM-dependent methyltransferase